MSHNKHQWLITSFLETVVNAPLDPLAISLYT